MNLTRLLIAAVVLAGLGGLVYWSGKREEANKDKGNRDTPKILAIEESKVRKIEIKPREGDATVIARDDAGKWEITAPTKLTADGGNVTSLLGSVSSLTAERIVDEKPNPSDLGADGLNPALVTVTFTLADGKTPSIKIGEATAASSGVYAMVEGDKRLFTVSSSTKDSLNKTAKDLRDKHLLSFDSDKISRVEYVPAG